MGFSKIWFLLFVLVQLTACARSARLAQDQNDGAPLDDHAKSKEESEPFKNEAELFTNESELFKK